MPDSAAVSYGQATPYFPILDLLRRYCHLEERDDARTIQTRVTEQVRTLDAALQDTIPALLALLDALPADDSFWQLDASQRRVLHARIVEALEALAGDQVAEQVERLAHHALRGEVWDKALTYCRQAGEKALVRSAHREAVGYYEQALSVLPRLGQVSVFLAVQLRFMGVYDQAIVAAQRALALATDSRDVVLHALTNQHLGTVYYSQGDYRRAIDCLRQTVKFFEGVRRCERFGEVLPPAVYSRAYLAECHAELGMFPEGRTLAEEGYRIAEAVDHPCSLMYALWGIGLLALRQGDLLRALPLLERAVGLCQEVDLPIYFPRIATALGAAYTLGGRITDAVPLLTQAMEQAIATDMVGLQALCGILLGEAQMLAGRLQEAQSLAEHALALARAHQERGHQSYALRLLSDIAAHREPPEIMQAEAHYHQALALADELGMRPLVAHCHHGLGRLYGQTSRGEQARAALTTAIDLYRAMDMTFWLPQAEAALAHVGAAPAPRVG